MPLTEPDLRISHISFAWRTHNWCSCTQHDQRYQDQASISRRLFTNMTNTPPGKAPKHANPKTKDVGVFWTHLDRRLLLSNTDSRYLAGHPALTNSGLALNRLIRSRICRKSAFGTTTSAIWNTTYRECLTTLAPIPTSFSGRVLSDHVFTDWGSARCFRKLPRL